MAETRTEILARTLRGLRAGSVSERVQAARALGEMDDSAGPAVASLEQALRDESPAVRESAAKALGRFKERASSAIPALHSLLQSHDASERAAALKSITVIIPDTRETLVAIRNGLNDQSGFVRAVAVGRLGSSAYAKALVPVFGFALGDRDSRVRLKAARAFKQLGAAASGFSQQLRQALLDEDPGVCAAAREALITVDPVAFERPTSNAFQEGRLERLKHACLRFVAAEEAFWKRVFPWLRNGHA